MLKYNRGQGNDRIKTGGKQDEMVSWFVGSVVCDTADCEVEEEEIKVERGDKLMSELERLEFENKELRAECEFLRKMLTDERRFFLETMKHDSVEEYRKVLHINQEHEKELQKATQY